MLQILMHGYTYLLVDSSQLIHALAKGGSNNASQKVKKEVYYC